MIQFAEPPPHWDADRDLALEFESVLGRERNVKGSFSESSVTGLCTTQSNYSGYGFSEASRQPSDRSTKSSRAESGSFRKQKLFETISKETKDSFEKPHAFDMPFSPHHMCSEDGLQGSFASTSDVLAGAADDEPPDIASTPSHPSAPPFGAASSAAAPSEPQMSIIQRQPLLMMAAGPTLMSTNPDPAQSPEQFGQVCASSAANLIYSQMPHANALETQLPRCPGNGGGNYAAGFGGTAQNHQNHLAVVHGNNQPSEHLNNHPRPRKKKVDERKHVGIITHYLVAGLLILIIVILATCLCALLFSDLHAGHGREDSRKPSSGERCQPPSVDGYITKCPLKPHNVCFLTCSRMKSEFVEALFCDEDSKKWQNLRRNYGGEGTFDLPECKNVSPADGFANDAETGTGTVIENAKAKIADIDTDKIKKKVKETVENIDTDKIKKNVKETIANIDTDKITDHAQSVVKVTTDIAQTAGAGAKQAFNTAAPVIKGQYDEYAPKVKEKMQNGMENLRQNIRDAANKLANNE